MVLDFLQGSGAANKISLAFRSLDRQLTPSGLTINHYFTLNAAASGLSHPFSLSVPLSPFYFLILKGLRDHESI